MKSPLDWYSGLTIGLKTDVHMRFSLLEIVSFSLSAFAHTIFFLSAFAPHHLLSAFDTLANLERLVEWHCTTHHDSTMGFIKRICTWHHLQAYLRTYHSQAHLHPHHITLHLAVVL